MDVALIQWPADEERRAELAARRQPRLLLVEPESHPPECTDEFEDWIRLPAEPGDVKARVGSLIARRESSNPGVVSIDDHGLVGYLSSRVELTPHQAKLLRPLVEHFGTVVSRSELIAAVWPQGPPNANTLEVGILRLRQRIEPLGLRIKTVRSRGYLLDDAGSSHVTLN